jgi:integrase
MSITIKYAYLKDQTWMFRRNYPADVRFVLGSQALKQSLRTGDPRIARTRAAEVNARFDQIVARTRATGKASLETLASCSEPATPDDVWRQAAKTLRAALDGERAALPAVAFQPDPSRLVSRRKVDDLAKEYLRKRGRELQPGGYKSVRYSIGLFVSVHGTKPACLLSPADGKRFVDQVSRLAPTIGKSHLSRNLDLDGLVRFSERQGSVISVRTQKRIVSQVSCFLGWAVKEGHIAANPFASVGVDQRVRPAPYAVLTNEEVRLLLSDRDHALHTVILFCLLTGMRAGEAVGLLREDLVSKGNLGVFALVRPNRLRGLKTEASERVVPLHGVLQDRLGDLPVEGPLFPDLKVSIVTKRFATLRGQLGLDRPGLVFHSTRKWFITQCERAGVPEHFTASLVGHQSARSENRLTYSIYSAGISDEQKRGIIDAIRLPE